MISPDLERDVLHFFLEETTPAERANLAGRIRGNREAEAFLLRMQHLHGNIGKAFSDVEAFRKADRRFRPVPFLATAAALLIAVLFWVFFRNVPPDATAPKEAAVAVVSPTEGPADLHSFDGAFYESLSMPLSDDSAPPGMEKAVVRIEKREGKVYRLSEEKVLPAEKGDWVLPGEGIGTGEDGKAVFSIGRMARGEIREETEITLVDHPDNDVQLEIRSGSLDVCFPGPSETGILQLLSPHGTASGRKGGISVRVGEEETLFFAKEEGASVTDQDGGVSFLLPGKTLRIKSRRKTAVEDAIRRGIAYLRKTHSPDDPFWNSGHANRQLDELLLLTYLHAGPEMISPNHSDFRRLLERALSRPPERTYNVALLAVCLEEIDSLRYRPELIECARFLANAQCHNGQWTYGLNSLERNMVPSSWNGSKPVVPADRLVSVHKEVVGSPAGDNSNSFFAALGIRACWAAGIQFPDEVIRKGAAWWEHSRDREGFWKYGKAGQARTSMTCGGVAGLSVYQILRGESPSANGAAREGADWIARSFRKKYLRDGPADSGEKWFFFSLFALERAGSLYEEAPFEKSRFKKVADILLDLQSEDGKWVHAGEKNRGQQDRGVSSTCFVLLFLRNVVLK